MLSWFVTKCSIFICSPVLATHLEGSRDPFSGRNPQVGKRWSGEPEPGIKEIEIREENIHGGPVESARTGDEQVASSSPGKVG